METIFYHIVWLALLISLLGNLASRRGRVKINKYLGWLGLIIGWIGSTCYILLRWLEAGHSPLVTFYEVTVFFIWALLFMYGVMSWRWSGLRVIAPLVSAGGLLGWLYLALLDPTIQPLIPALQSNWLVAHVILCFLSYAGFFISFIGSAVWLVRKDRQSRAWAAALLIIYVSLVFGIGIWKGGMGLKINWTLYSIGVLFISIIGYFLILTQVQVASITVPSEDFIYYPVTLSFPLLTLGIFTGAVWAEVAWGSYWSWDPKETWALITWLIYAAYLHARYRWKDKIALRVWLAFLGFGAVLFTWLGVNYLLSGLHSYG